MERDDLRVRDLALRAVHLVERASDDCAVAARDDAADRRLTRRHPFTGDGQRLAHERLGQ